jgi:threonyl-tRNA synthetase
MKLLFIHADFIEYQTKKKTKIAEEITENLKFQRAEEVLVVFTAIEREEQNLPLKATMLACNEIVDVFNKVKADRIMLYPYAHLSSNLSNPETAIKVLKSIEKKLLDDGYEITRAPFGWYKKFGIKCKGHPLSELSRDIVVSKDKQRVSKAIVAEKKLESKWYVLYKGLLTPANEFDFTKYPSLKIFYNYETSGTRTNSSEPPHIRLMKDHEFVDYEPGSDSGNLRWYPKGTLIKKILEKHVTNMVLNYGAMQVETPIMYDFEHPKLSKYLDRFPARQYVIKSEDKEYFLRFAACFGQYLMNHDMTISHKNLPLQIYELTHYSFRREQRGELAGLKRLRTFTMPDMHTLCKDLDDAKKEFIAQYKLSMNWMEDINVKYDVAMRLVKEFYDNNKEFINNLVDLVDKPVLIELWDQRFFYFVMKFEFSINDALNKAATLSTVQIDVENSERFDINYIDEKNNAKHPLMLHASISGGIDRNLYALLENEWMKMQKGIKPMLPVWLSPTQIRIIPVSNEQLRFCLKLLDEFEKCNIRVDIDDETNTLQKKIRNAEKEWIPFIVVIGKKEVQSNNLTVRVRNIGGNQKKFTTKELIKHIQNEIGNKPFKQLSLSRKLSKRPKFR